MSFGSVWRPTLIVVSQPIEGCFKPLNCISNILQAYCCHLLITIICSCFSWVSVIRSASLTHHREIAFASSQILEQTKIEPKFLCTEDLPNLTDGRRGKNGSAKRTVAGAARVPRRRGTQNIEVSSPPLFWFVYHTWTISVAYPFAAKAKLIAESWWNSGSKDSCPLLVLSKVDCNHYCWPTFIHMPVWDWEWCLWYFNWFRSCCTSSR
jgi:hypothetical protein